MNELTTHEQADLQQHEDTRLTLSNSEVLKYAGGTTHHLGAPTSTPKEVGEALRAIRDRELFREAAGTFYDYCMIRFGLFPDRVDAFLRAADLPATPDVVRTDGSDKKESVIYFLSCGDKVKIGLTTDLPRRLRNIRNMSPVSLELLGVIPGDAKLERELHRRFGQYRQHGEWFSSNPELVDFISRSTNNAS